MIEFLILMSIIISILFIFFNFYYTDYLLHKSMTIKIGKKYKKGNFDQFLSDFNGKKWKVYKYHKFDFCGIPSLFNNKTNSKIHASLIVFDGIYYLYDNKCLKKIIKFLNKYWDENDNKIDFVEDSLFKNG